MAERIREIGVQGGKAVVFESELGELAPGHLRVKTRYSAVSAGTELMGLESATNPEEPPRAFGYQLSGVVEELSPELEGMFRVGQAVACYGGPYVHHGSVLHVPKHLATPVPEGLEMLSASYCGLGTIALHAFRRGGLSLGETVAVVGLGMLGNLVAQTAQAAGCRVSALDSIEFRRDRAAQCGLDVKSDMEALKAAVMAHSAGQGADAVFIVVANCSDELLAQCVDLLRHRGHIVIVGTGHARIPREAFFMKEPYLTVSRAGGPGRYDRDYEFGGRDYPYSLVRWTEGRNLEEAVRLMGLGLLNPAPLITDVLPPEKANDAYQALIHTPMSHMGVIFDWNA